MSLQEKLKKLRVHSHGLGLVKKWEVLEAVREVVSQIQELCENWAIEIHDKLVANFPKYIQWELQYRDGFVDGFKEGYLIAKKDDLALLVSPSTPTEEGESKDES